MERQDIESILAAADERLAAGGSLAGTGFRRVVREVKADPELARDHADRIARIDDAAFRRWPMLVVPIVPGTILALVAAAVGLGLVAWSYRLADGSQVAAVVAFFAGFGVLAATTHGLGHLVVGRLLGIRFTAWYVASPGRPQPGVKIDYASYLRSTRARRAWMHASGAIVTKVLPFALIGAARAAGLPGWVTWALVGIGFVMIVTDVMFSTRKSDWSRVIRELRS